MLSEVGIYWRTEMDDVRGLDTYILAASGDHARIQSRNAHPVGDAGLCKILPEGERLHGCRYCRRAR
ncbi:hypothetical protein [Escherichia sp. E4694]|uniref:hypothetical protein n=1 Tax=Escherichia sp. E4694 TaxID=2044464 RepID=UPI001F118C51|nr:hypothetical protein [Escherichia sp. E4694]